MRKANYLVAGAAIAVVVIAVAGGLMLLGSPGEERARRLDERRVQDLRGIALETDRYWTKHRRLPVSLTELAGDSGADLAARDPATTELYGYRVIDAGMYEVCGLFERVSPVGQFQAAADFWSHRAGRQCFQLTAHENRPLTIRSTPDPASVSIALRLREPDTYAIL